MQFVKNIAKYFEPNTVSCNDGLDAELPHDQAYYIFYQELQMRTTRLSTPHSKEESRASNICSTLYSALLAITSLLKASNSMSPSHSQSTFKFSNPGTSPTLVSKNRGKTLCRWWWEAAVQSQSIPSWLKLPKTWHHLWSHQASCLWEKWTAKVVLIAFCSKDWTLTGT